MTRLHLPIRRRRRAVWWPARTSSSAPVLRVLSECSARPTCSTSPRCHGRTSWASTSASPTGTSSANTLLPSTSWCSECPGVHSSLVLGAQYPHTLALTFDPSARQLACVYSDHSVYVWDVHDVRSVRKLYSALYHSSSVWSLEVSVSQKLCRCFSSTSRSTFRSLGYLTSCSSFCDMSRTVEL